MGQQQLLLIALGTIIVGIAIVVGINLFLSSAIKLNRDQVISDLMNLASNAQAFYKKELGYGGGGGSFNGWDIPEFYKKYAGGKVRVRVRANRDKVILTGIGTEIGRNGRSKVRVRLVVRPNNTRLIIKN